MTGRYRRRNMWARVISLVVMTLALTACASELDHAVRPPDNGISTPTSSPVSGAAYEGAWRLIEGEGPRGPVRPTKGWDVSASIAEGLIAGNSSCNNYYIAINIDGSSLSFTGGGSIEEMGCGGPTDVQDEYIAALMASIEIERQGDRLIISGPDSHLTFEAVASAPMDEMVGREWRLETYIQDGRRTRAVAPATLRFTRVELNPKNAIQGKYAGTTGCGRFSGTWTVQGERVVFLSGSYRGGRCSDDTLQEQHDSVNMGISDWLTAEVAGDKLTIFGDRSRLRLVYRAAK